MKIFYRTTSFKQHSPPPIYEDDKWALVKFCHESFLKAKRDEPVTYLLDRCEGWTDYFSKFGEVINYIGADTAYSINYMFNLAKQENGKILMLEDDYIWRPDTVKYLWRGLDEFKMVSPYDHPAHYLEGRFENFLFKLKLVDDVVWRNAPSNTHTFGTTGEYMREKWDIFKDGMWDGPMYEALPDRVWNPTYSLATHMCRGLMAPNVDWSPYLKTSV